MHMAAWQSKCVALYSWTATPGLLLANVAKDKIRG